MANWESAELVFWQKKLIFFFLSKPNNAWSSFLEGKFQIFLTFCWMFRIIHKQFYNRDLLIQSFFLVLPNLSRFAVQNAVRTWQKHMNNNLKIQRRKVPRNDVHPNLIKSCLTTWLNVRKRDSAHFCTFNLTHCTMNYVTVSIFNPKFWQFINQVIQ